MFNAESRRRSGRKQSRTERNERFERRQLQRSGAPDGTERRFGIKLQEAVSKQLSRIGVPHRLIPYRDDYARDERVELIVLGEDRQTSVAEIQYTLRRHIRGKIEDFIRAATAREEWTVPRLYIEIEDHVGHALKPMAERVAHAIRDIVREISEWTEDSEQGNVVGLALVLDHDRKMQIFPMRLLRMIGSKARAMLKELLAPPTPTPALIEEPAVISSPVPVVATAKPKPRTNPPPAPFYLRLVASLHDRFPGFTPHPAPVYASSQRHFPIRQPR